MAYTWTKGRASKRIATRISEVRTVIIKDYVRDTDLSGIPVGTAYRVDGVHLYIDILNLDGMLASTSDEGVTCHRRTLRFLNLHFRAVRRVLQSVNAIEVDFHNQRLHAVFVKPYGDEAQRVHRAIATAQLIIDVLNDTGESGEESIPSAQVRVGLDTGIALAVNNGRKGHREPLFLGEPANRAAKRAGGGTALGIYVTNNAREVVELDEVDDEDAEPLNEEAVDASKDEADLDVTPEEIIKAWREDLRSNPIGRFEFRGHTPPFSNLELGVLSPSNSRRQSAVSVYADLDGFTDFVSSRIDDDRSAKDVVRVLHVVRSELDAALVKDFGGCKVRFIGDCIHGILAEGTAQTTDEDRTMSTATLAAGAIRSGFDLAIEMLGAEGWPVDGLGLAIGFEFGPLSVTRLGMKGDMVPCAIGRGVLVSEDEQDRCGSTTTAIGAKAYAKANEAVRQVFRHDRMRDDLDYGTAVNELKKGGDQTAKLSAVMGAPLSGVLLQPAIAAAPPLSFPGHRAAPVKPRGFA